MRLYRRIRWWLRYWLPPILSPRQAALCDAVTVHASISGADDRVLIANIGNQLGATEYDRRVVAYLIGADQ